jgi:hypothetical protein
VSIIIDSPGSHTEGLEPPSLTLTVRTMTLETGAPRVDPEFTPATILKMDSVILPLAAEVKELEATIFAVAGR